MPADEEIVALEASAAGIGEIFIRGAVVNMNFLINPDDEDVPAES